MAQNKKLLDLAVDCRMKAAGGTDQFPYLLGDSMHKVVIDNFRQIPQTWKYFGIPTSVSDFKDHNRIILSEAERLLKRKEHESVHDSYLSEKKYKVYIENYERAFSITREMIVNDDQDALRKVPAILGRSAGREIPYLMHEVLAAAGSSLAYDGVAYFHSTHGNTANNTLAANITGAGYILTGINAIKAQKDIANRHLLGLKPKYLITGTTLFSIAKRLCQNETTDNGAGVQVANPVYGMLEPIEDPFMDLTSTTAWYVVCDPNDVNALEFPFLDGVQEPQVFSLASNTVNLAGGIATPYDFHYSELKYKVALDFGVGLAEYKAIYRGKA